MILTYVARFIIINVNGSRRQQIGQSVRHVVGHRRPRQTNTTRSRHTPLQTGPRHIIVAAFLGVVINIRHTGRTKGQFGRQTFGVNFTIMYRRTVLFRSLIKGGRVHHFTTCPQRKMTKTVQTIKRLRINLGRVALAQLRFILPLFARNRGVTTGFITSSSKVNHRVIKCFFVIFARVNLFPKERTRTIDSRHYRSFVLLRFEGIGNFRARIAFTVGARDYYFRGPPRIRQ